MGLIPDCYQAHTNPTPTFLFGLSWTFSKGFRASALLGFRTPPTFSRLCGELNEELQEVAKHFFWVMWTQGPMVWQWRQTGDQGHLGPCILEAQGGRISQSNLDCPVQPEWWKQGEAMATWHWLAMGLLGERSRRMGRASWCCRKAFTRVPWGPSVQMKTSPTGVCQETNKNKPKLLKQEWRGGKLC